MGRPSFKEKIVAAATETLHKKGFNGSSVQDITEAADVPKGSFYNHFESKEHLALEVLERYWQETQKVMEALADTSLPARDRLVAYFHTLGNISRNGGYDIGCMIGNLSSEMPSHSERMRTRLMEILATWSDGIARCVREAQADGTIASALDANDLASFLLTSWQGAAMRAKVDQTHKPFAIFEAVTLHGVLAPTH
jgi:TetR/AcrR family transcriptional repressor of nem operon